MSETALKVPTKLWASRSGFDENGCNFIEWSWDSVEDADGYEVQFGSDPDFVLAKPHLRPHPWNRSYLQVNLPATPDNWFRVRAYRLGETTEYSDWSVPVCEPLPLQWPEVAHMNAPPQRRLRFLDPRGRVGPVYSYDPHKETWERESR